jgi:hypothetical protein
MSFYVNFHSALDLNIGRIQELFTSDNACIVDQKCYLNLFLDLNRAVLVDEIYYGMQKPRPMHTSAAAL